MIAYLIYVLAATKINLTISNATTFAMRHQGPSILDDRLPPIPPSYKTQLRSLWLTLKAFVYRVCDSQFFRVHHILAFNIIELPFTSLTVADGRTFT